MKASSRKTNLGSGLMLLALLALGACTKGPTGGEGSSTADSQASASQAPALDGVMPPIVVVDQNGQLIDDSGNKVPEASIPRVRPFVYIPPPAKPANRIYNGVGGK